MLLEWYIICAKVKSWCVSCGRLVFLTWYIYECQYEMSWIRMIKPLSLSYMNDMRPWMLIRKSFMWNLQPSGKVMILEVESNNGILLIWMVDLRLVGWNNMKSSLVKSLSYPHLHWKAALGDRFGRVNVIGLWNRYGTSSCDP